MGLYRDNGKQTRDYYLGFRVVQRIRVSGSKDSGNSDVDTC